MDRKLTETYSNQILLESKKGLNPKKPSPVVKKMPEDVISDGKAKKFVSKSGPEAVKGIKAPQKHSKTTDESVEWESRFAKIFKRVLNENDELQEPVQDELPEVEPSENAEESDIVNDSAESEGDVVADLQDVVSKLQDILSALGGGDESEGSVDDGSEEFEAENPVNDEIDQIESGEPKDEVKESLGDIKSALSGLKAKIGQLTGKANKVKGALAKTSGGKADAGDSVDLEPIKKSDLHAKNSYKVDSKLKTGSSLFEKRK